MQERKPRRFLCSRTHVSMRMFIPACWRKGIGKEKGKGKVITFSSSFFFFFVFSLFLFQTLDWCLYGFVWVLFFTVTWRWRRREKIATRIYMVRGGIDPFLLFKDKYTNSLFLSLFSCRWKIVCLSFFFLLLVYTFTYL